MSGLTIGSLFSGYGGLDLAVKRVFPDAETAFVSDIDKGACKILAHRFSDVPNLGDITAVDWSTVGRVDVLTGGFPCQDVSHAGRRAGLIRGETRTGLWAEMCRAIDELRPALVFAENVRGLLSAQADSDVEPCPWCLGDERDSPMRALGAILADLADLGYDAAWCGLPASAVGAAHGRFRVFILAWPADAPPNPTSLRGREGDRDWIGRSEAGEWTSALPVGADRGPDPRGVTLLSTPQSRDHKGVPADGFNTANLCRDISLLPTTTTKDANASGGNPGTTGSHGTTLTDATVRQSDRWGDYAAAINRWESVHWGPAPDPTQTSAKGNPQLSPRFTEWLMGLAAGWITDVPSVTRNEALKACGNGVVPQQGEAALRWLLAVMASALGVAA